MLLELYSSVTNKNNTFFIKHYKIDFKTFMLFIFLYFSKEEGSVKNSNFSGFGLTLIEGGIRNFWNEKHANEYTELSNFTSKLQAYILVA